MRVLDFSHAAAGPYATMFMADMGAEVIKIEKQGRGDGARFMGTPLLSKTDSDYYVGLNRNKKDVLLDLGKPEAVDLAGSSTPRSRRSARPVPGPTNRPTTSSSRACPG
jgi:crotonobetainyl-CoA:carnitine CoA-transferase CaiB-like acyl-CoA transferase